jgi:hypothetical protein
MFTSTTVASLPVMVRWTFIGLLTYADDQGRGRDEARLVKAAVWPLDDDVSWQRVAEHLDDLERAGLICRYEGDGKRLLHVSGWPEHQVISHPAKPKLPECPKASHRSPPDGHRRDSGELPEERGETPLGTGKGKEQGTGKGSTTIVEQARPIDDVTRVFQAWQASTGRHRANLDANRRQAIHGALKAYPLEDVLDAVKGWVNDPWPDRAQQNDLAQLLHMGSKRKPKNILEAMRDLQRNGRPVTAGRRTRELAENAHGLRALVEQLEGGNADGAPRVGTSRRPNQRELSGPAG